MNAFAARIGQGDTDFHAPARAAYERLIAPAESLIRDKRVLCIAADGPLWPTPFQALQAADGHFLIERHDVFYAPSLSVLAWYASHRHAPTKAAHQVLAFGDPRAAGVTPLPDAEEEVDALRAIYGERATRVRVRTAATETRFKSEAAQFRILHLATHGTLDDADPMYSNLVFARSPGDVDDGLLEAWEIEQMPLHADLAVLSACDTGRGHVRGGEGITGMSWALLAAGCPTAVVSRFAVGSSSTRELMIAFHRRLASSNLSARAITAALCDAERNLLCDGGRRHPFHWSAFFVFGQGW
jgi:CHAT domain-containing protein